jgi:hypothetical protein
MQSETHFARGFLATVILGPVVVIAGAVDAFANLATGVIEWAFTDEFKKPGSDEPMDGA